MRKEHNGIISFWKFMFSIMIIAFHTGILYPNSSIRFSSGRMGVEFFFLVSGYLLCLKSINYKKIKNEDIGYESVIFIKNKIKRFSPYIMFLLIIAIPACFFIFNYRIPDFTISLYNILLLPVENGIHYDIFAILWYISVLLVCQFLMFPLIIKYRKNYIYYFAPIIVFALSSYLLIKYGSLGDPWIKDVFSYKGVVRGLMLMNAGVIIYSLSEKIKTIKLTDFSKFFLTIIEIIGYLSIFVIVNNRNADTRYAMLSIIIMTICISISFSTQSMLYSFSNNKLFYFLEKISLPFYINQWLLLYILKYVQTIFNLNAPYYIELVIMIIVSFIVAIIELKIFDVFKKKNDSIKKIFIN